MVMLLGSKIILRHFDWWSITFLLLCSTKFVAGGSLPVQANEDILKELENNLQESENDRQELYSENGESGKDLLEADGNFEVQPRALSVLFGAILAKIVGKRVYRWAKNRNQAGHRPNSQVAYPPNGYPPAQYPYPPQYGGYQPSANYQPAAYKPPGKVH